MDSSSVNLRQLACEANGGHQFYRNRRFGVNRAYVGKWATCARCGVSARDVVKEELVAAWNATKR